MPLSIHVLLQIELSSIYVAIYISLYIIQYITVTVPFVFSGRRAYLSDWSCNEINKTIGKRGG